MLAAAGRGLLIELDADDGEPVAGEDLGDPGAHRAEADDPDRLEGAGGLSGFRGRRAGHVGIVSWVAPPRHPPYRELVHAPATW